MNVLGISCFYHDAAACLIQDGKLVAAAEEERFSRKKHDFSYPKLAIDYCLRQGGIDGSQLDAVAFYEKPMRKLERALVIGKQYKDRTAPVVESELRQFLHEGVTVEHRVRDALGFQGKFFFSEHHLSHAASAFYGSPFQAAAVLTVDGVGEWATVSQFVGEDRKLTLKREINYPHSLGMFYATMTAFLGFEVNEGEYKVMGLASYGEPTFVDKIEQMIELLPDGSFVNNLDYFSYMYSLDSMFTDKLVELLGPPRHPKEPVTKRHMDIASSMQLVTERAMINLVRSMRDHTESPNLCLAGGVAHNVVANTRVWQDGTFKNFFIQPSSGDSGGAVGAAWYAYYNGLDQARQVQESYDTCVGPAYGDDEIRAALDKRRLTYERLEFDELARRTAELINENLIIGWHQGRMEFGPRALGNRSLLANPCDPKMKDILNARVKLREDFRPFAPAVLEERVSEFFEFEGKSPFMLMTPQVREDKKDVIPSVTHADGSARVQTVSAEQNPRFYGLISAFGDLTGVPVVINTSFNVRGEPIVCTPEDSVKCFLGTDIDYLVIGDYLVEKPF